MRGPVRCVASRFAVLSSLFLAAVTFTGSLGGTSDPLHANPQPPVTDLAGAVAIAKAATSWQASVLGVAMPAHVPTPAHAHPSEAVLALAARHGVTPDAGQAAQVAKLDLLPEAKAKAFTQVVDSFLAAEDATARSLHSVDTLESDRAGTRVDLGPMLSSRYTMWDASLALAQAWPDLPIASTSDSAPPTLDLCPAIAVDLDGFDTSYASYCGLTLDLGGDDIYTNGAGGSSSTISCEGVGALIDLSGNDQYLGRSTCASGTGGINGGGYAGFGFLLDAAGNDAYSAAQPVANGGAFDGVGSLLDVAGNDTYTAGSSAVNGGSNGGGGLLLDAGGTDSYVASDGGAGTDRTVVPKGLVGAQIDQELSLGSLCPQGVDPDHAGACGTVLCPTGLTSPPGPGQLATICGVGVPALVGILPQCSDGVDNDGDGRTDFSPMALGGGDPNCNNPFDNDEGA
jgi:hypothetical protein